KTLKKMKTSAKTKSVFLPLTPKITPLQPAASKPPDPHSGVTTAPTQSKAQPEPDKPRTPRTATTQLWLQLTGQSKHQMFGWAYNTKRDGQIRVVTVLNYTHPLVLRALKESDHDTIRSLAGFALVELLYFRQRNWFMAALADELIKAVFDPAG